MTGSGIFRSQAAAGEREGETEREAAGGYSRASYEQPRLGSLTEPVLRQRLAVVSVNSENYWRVRDRDLFVGLRLNFGSFPFFFRPAA